MPQLRDSKKQGLRDFFLRRAQMEGATVFHATYQEIADESGVSLGTVVKGLKVLESEGFIKIKKGPSRRVPNAYAVLTSSHDSSRTLGEELQDARRERDEAVQAADRLAREVRAWRRLRASFVVHQPLPGELVMAVYPLREGAFLEDWRQEEDKAVRRLLDRRGIGAGLRRLRSRPDPAKVMAFVRRVKRRMAIQVDPGMMSPGVQAATQFIETHVLPLAQASDVAGDLDRAQRAYEDLLRSLMKEREDGAREAWGAS